MRKKRIVAMLLAGGQGSRLGVLTSRTAKPAVPFGGKYRLIDFPLSNCANSDIDTVGVLTQYEPLELNAYLGTGQAWDLDRLNGGVYVLPPYRQAKRGSWYTGTANAIYQNMAFISQYNPDYVLILSGDHIYKMNYARMLAFHQEKRADATIAVLRVPITEAGRFGIMNTDGDGRILEFEEKPAEPKSNKASMGIYIFSWPILREFLEADKRDEDSSNDFGHDVIPAMLRAGKTLYSYDFEGYWRDVGTIGSLWEANMDLLESPPKLNLYDPVWRIYGRSPIMPPHYVSAGASVSRSIVSEGAAVYGTVSHSIIYYGATIEEGAVISDSVIMPNVRIGRGAKVKKAIIGEGATVGENALVGAEPTVDDDAYDRSLTGDITLIGENAVIPEGAKIPAGKVMTISYKARTGGPRV